MISSKCHDGPERDLSEGFETEIDEFTRYRVGITAARYDPAQESYDDMLFLVAYDIRDHKRLAKIAKTCEDYGVRVEYSVFECDLSEENFMAMWSELLKIADEEDDALLAYRLCGACVKNIESFGSVVRPGKVLVYFV